MANHYGHVPYDHQKPEEGPDLDTRRAAYGMRGEIPALSLQFEQAELRAARARLKVAKRHLMVMTAVDLLGRCAALAALVYIAFWIGTSVVDAVHVAPTGAADVEGVE